METLYGGVRFLDDAGPCLSNVRRIDMGALPLICKMAETGLMTDLSHFEKMEKTLVADMEKITEDVREMTGYYINLNSGPQKSDLLFKKLGLKQARPKMTTSGDRESVENEVLVAIQHDHDVVPKLLEYAELSKLLGTYVRPMPKLARRVAFGEWRMFPNFTYTRVPSGRLSCKSPNLLAMPTRTERGRQIREGFTTYSDWSYLSVDLCLHPDTKVKTVFGDKPISDIKAGDKVLTHRDDMISYGAVTKSCAITPREAYRLTFDNGESVIASDEHKWPTYTPRKRRGISTIVVKTTEELRVGERMVACREGECAGYLTWYCRSAFSYTKQHKLIAEAVYGPCPDNHHIHHKNTKHQDNHPDNLEYKLDTKHLSDHGKENYAKQDHTLRIERLREGIKGRDFNGSNNPKSKINQITRDLIHELVKANPGIRGKALGKKTGLSTTYCAQLLRKIRTGRNHKIVAMEYLGEQPMWAITVEPDHNYVLAAGVVTMNSQIEPRVAAHRSRDENLCSIYINDEDIYSDFATTANDLEDKRYFDKEKHKWIYPTVDKDDHRRPAKTCVLAALYDVTGAGLLEQMTPVCARCRWISLPTTDAKYTKHGQIQPCSKFVPLWTENKCQDLINKFYMRYPGLMTMRKLDHARMRRYAYCWDLFGRILHVQAVRSIHEWVVTAALREGSNHPMQSTAQAVIKLAMAKIHDLMEHNDLFEIVHPLLQIHDELLFECATWFAEEFKAIVQDCFNNIIKLIIPIKSSGEIASSWGTLPK